MAKEICRLRDLIQAEKRAFSPDEKTAWDKANADYDSLSAQINVAQRAEAIEQEQCGANPQPAPSVASFIGGKGGDQGGEVRAAKIDEEQRCLATQAWFWRNTRNKRSLTERHIRACEATGIDPHGEELILRIGDTGAFNEVRNVWSNGPREFSTQRAQQHFRTLSSLTAATGGALTMPETMMNQLEIALLQFGGILDVCDTIRTDGRERFRWPTANDTGNKGRRLGEAKATAELNPTFAATYWDAYKYTSDEIFVPYELSTGTPYNLPAILGGMLFERIARKLADDLTTGTGVDQPTGFVTDMVAKSATRAAGSATAISWDDLDNLITSVDPAYRNGASFSFHDSTRNAIAKLKDGMGRPLWADNANGSAPSTLKGYPWTINQSMDSTIASGKYSVAFGQHRAYKARMVGQVRLYRLIEKYRDTTDSDAYLAFLEADGKLLDAGTHPCKVLSH